jgi:hypothetical protein
MIQNAREIFGVDLSPDNAALLDALGIMGREQADRLVSAGADDRSSAEWTPETVKRRLVQAAELIESVERRVGPSRQLTHWINWQLFRGISDFDRNAWAEGEREGTREPDRFRRGASTAEIERAEAALEWPRRYLADEGERRVLAFWIHCDLSGAPFGRLAHKVAGSKGTAYRRLENALRRIVIGLNTDTV